MGSCSLGECQNREGLNNVVINIIRRCGRLRWMKNTRYCHGECCLSSGVRLQVHDYFDRVGSNDGRVRRRPNGDQACSRDGQPAKRRAVKRRKYVVCSALTRVSLANCIGIGFLRGQILGRC